MPAFNGKRSLAEKLATVGNLAQHFYHDTIAPHVKATPGLTPVPAERTNWIEEQRAWHNTAILFDQSHHMPELFVKGPDAKKMLESLGINSWANFQPGRAKQYICCNEEGYVIGETLMYCYAEDDFELVSGGPLLNWVEYNALTGGWNVTVVRDNNTARNPDGRTKFRFGMDGPNAGKIFAEAIEGEVPEVKFFWHTDVRIAGCDVTMLRHGMAGHQGCEISGKYADIEKVRSRLLEVGEKYGIQHGGFLTYFSATAESAWMASPFPAIFTSPSLQKYREWLPEDTWEAGAQLGGSFVSENIEDYYVTPWDLGSSKLIKFNHDFVGRGALEKMAEGKPRHRRSLIWNKDDVAMIFRSLMEPAPACKMMRLPYAAYAYQMYDAVRNKDGEVVGHSTFVGYTANEEVIMSLVMIDEDHAEPGTELVLTWGEPDGGSRKAHVERHRQCDVRVTVADAPLSKYVREKKTQLIEVA